MPPIAEIHITTEPGEDLRDAVKAVARSMNMEIIDIVSVKKTESGNIEATAHAGEPAEPTRGRRGRKPKEEAVAAAAALSDEPGEGVGAGTEDDGFDPFGTEEKEEDGLDLEQLKTDTIARLQKLAKEKGGLDTLRAITDKYNTTKEKGFKFQALDSTIFVKIADDLDKLKVA